MRGQEQSPTSVFDINLRTAAIAFFLLTLLSTTVAGPRRRPSPRCTNLPMGRDGGEPQAGLSMDRAGNFYGTASTGGNTTGNCAIRNPHGCGTVFQLSRKGSGWLLTPIYTFSGPDGSNPQARVIVGPDGSLYGTTIYGGDANEGTVFNLRPPASACKSALCPWTETVLHSFQGFTDGAEPTFGDLVFDGAGNIYGTTPHGGQGDNGTVYKLTHSNGGWTETVLYRFQGKARRRRYSLRWSRLRSGRQLMGNDWVRRNL